MIKAKYLMVSIIFSFLSSSCGQAPEADASFADPSVRRSDHTFFTECAVCHEETRPTTSSHPASGDCVSCHEYPDWSNIISLR